MSLTPVATPCTRRDFLQTSALATAALAAGCHTPSVAAGGSWVDAHVHVWTPDLGRYPIDTSFQVADMQPPSFTPEQLFAQSRPAGVNRVVLIQMSFYRFDNRYLLEALHRYKGTFSGVGIVDESAADVAQRMRELAAHGVRGFRITPEKRSVADWLGSAGMATMWRTGADAGLALCPLMGPDALPALDQMCERFPRTRVVLDHFARIGVDGQFRPEHVAALCRLARHRQVYVKTSAFYALGRKRPPYDDLAPLIRQVREAFGARRLMWGSDCPYQVDPGHTYAESVALIRDRLDFLTPDDRQWMLRKTAESVFFG